MRPPITEYEKRTIVINRGQNLSMLYGMITSSDKARAEMIRLLKLGKVTKVVDNDDTLMYVLKEENNDRT